MTRTILPPPSAAASSQFVSIPPLVSHVVIASGCRETPPDSPFRPMYEGARADEAAERETVRVIDSGAARFQCLTGKGRSGIGVRTASRKRRPLPARLSGHGSRFD